MINERFYNECCADLLYLVGLTSSIEPVTCQLTAYRMLKEEVRIFRSGIYWQLNFGSTKNSTRFYDRAIVGNIDMRIFSAQLCDLNKALAILLNAGYIGLHDAAALLPILKGEASEPEEEMLIDRDENSMIRKITFTSSTEHPITLRFSDDKDYDSVEIFFDVTMLSDDYAMPQLKLTSQRV